MANSITADEIREQFSQAMSAMYQQEVPQYGTLLELVADVNLAVLENNPQLHEKMVNADELARLNVERHGAIRVGTAQELATLRRMFAIMGMYPVSYYDLSQAGGPVHSTAFRPIDDASLARNPFRVFTSLLRLELIENEILRQKAAEILRQRDIFTPRCRQLLEEYEQQGGFNETQAQEFVQEALETFRWHQSATVDEETYRALHNEHRLIADVVCFPGCHINHLTPRTLDIDRVQSMMPECGIEPKILIEGPPRREVPILLRQTSFKALEETVLFAGQKQGTHTARFGEIEQRGVALTPKGRQLYDDLLRNAGTGQDNLTHQMHLQETLTPKGRQLYDDLLRNAGTGQDNLTHQMHLQETFRTFPDSEFLMRQQGLAWFRYRLTPSGEAHRQAIHPGDDPQPLIERGWVVAQPITYEDFLPVSAAGIFQSNLGNETQTRSHGNASREAFEQALGCPVLDEFQLYQEAEERSKRRCGLL
ncbi:metalloenzyme [Escherichia coli]|nr:VOC family protein [Escherichia coli]GDG19791.1 metalloenzyme [Escherichia coli]